MGINNHKLLRLGDTKMQYFSKIQSHAGPSLETQGTDSFELLKKTKQKPPKTLILHATKNVGKENDNNLGRVPHI